MSGWPYYHKRPDTIFVFCLCICLFDRYLDYLQNILQEVNLVCSDVQIKELKQMDLADLRKTHYYTVLLTLLILLRMKNHSY